LIKKKKIRFFILLIRVHIIKLKIAGCGDVTVDSRQVFC